MSQASGLDWSGLMRAGLRELRLHPDQFWALTPAELGLMLGLDHSRPAMTRARLEELAARYADLPDLLGQGCQDEGD